MPPKRFIFRLQTVLNIRLKKEDEEKEKFAQLNALLRQAEQHLAYLKQTKLATEAELRDKLAAGKGLDMSELHRYNNWIKKLKIDIEVQTQKVEELKIAVEKQRQVLVEAMKDRKILEELREKHLEEFNREIDEEESKLIDELATLKYARDPGQAEEEPV